MWSKIRWQVFTIGRKLAVTVRACATREQTTGIVRGPKLFNVPCYRGETLAGFEQRDVEETQKTLIYHVETRNAKIVARIHRGRTWRVWTWTTSRVRGLSGRVRAMKARHHNRRYTLRAIKRGHNSNRSVID
ncbi:uncharacterized protein LOC143144761 [Ptiloglossa arizonensis]|uniref:uncharacterized protein LOC143144761 n=1 Tax=Ptiloglossa arizonensis TaxID=3350558 RepID=UPI003FA067A9